MVHYGGDVSAALLDLFPAIGLERSKLKGKGKRGQEESEGQ